MHNHTITYELQKHMLSMNSSLSKRVPRKAKTNNHNTSIEKPIVFVFLAIFIAQIYAKFPLSLQHQYYRLHDFLTWLLAGQDPNEHS